jgi:hypothetical protein
MSVVGEQLPHVDEHSVAVAAGPEATWDALGQVVESSVAGGAAPRLARLLGCADVTPSGPRPLADGAALPDFHVAVARAPVELALLGSHRFSDYALVFRLEGSSAETRLLAETRAAFPGFRGGLYRELVVGTRLHALVTRRILAAVKARAERASAAIR